MSVDALQRIDEALSSAALALSESDSALLDAQILLAFVLEKETIYLMTWPERLLSVEHQQAFDKLIEKRKKGMPVAYLTGVREFWSLAFKVNSSTLIPRPDTEMLVEQALKHCQPTSRILDLGTGTGAVILSLAHELPNAQCVGIDFNQNAVSLAKENANNLGIKNVELSQSDWFKNVTGSFDIIVSNPPYIDKADHHLDCGDVRFEPLSALVADNKGLSDIEIIVEQAKQHLKKNGYLLIEHGFEQAIAVQSVFKKHGYSEVNTVQDYGCNDRVTLGVLNDD